MESCSLVQVLAPGSHDLAQWDCPETTKDFAAVPHSIKTVLHGRAMFEGHISTVTGSSRSHVAQKGITFIAPIMRPSVVDVDAAIASAVDVAVRKERSVMAIAFNQHLHDTASTRTTSV